MSLSGLICRRLLCFFLFKETFGMRHWRQLFLLWSETCPQPEQRLFLMSFLVLFIAATRWRECGALTKRRRGGGEALREGKRTIATKPKKKEASPRVLKSSQTSAARGKNKTRQGGAKPVCEGRHLLCKKREKDERLALFLL